MAVYKGVSATMSYSGNPVAEGQGWRITSSLDVLDTTKFGDAGYKSFTGGLCEWGGTMNVNFDKGDTAQSAMYDTLSGATPSSTPTAAVFTIATGKTLSGTIVITQLEVNAAVAGIVSGTITFKGSGPITPAWA